MQAHDLIFIRHAESQINKSTRAIAQKYNIPNTYLFLKDYPEWTGGVKYSMNYIDCPITDFGKQQCIKAKLKADQLVPDVILVSPLQRTLQTCNILFGDRNIPIIVQPILTQSIRSSCDLTTSLSSKIKRYPQFNFQNVIKAKQKQGQMYYLLYDQLNGTNYLNKIRQSNAQTLDEKNRAVLEYMSQHLSYQTSQNMRKRIKKVKQLLKEYREKYNVIAIVAHFNTINYTITKQFDEFNDPKNSLKIHNCQMHFNNLQQILKYQ